MKRARVVLFSGGRGSKALSTFLAAQESVDLTLAINGYDDGKSTGEVRRFLGACLGPSDFRKNASTLAAAVDSCPRSVIDLLDRRLPVGCGESEALGALRCSLEGGSASSCSGSRDPLPPTIKEGIARAFDSFEEFNSASEKSFNFSDCAIGNIVFAGCFLESGCDFNRAVDAYSTLLGLEPGVILNVTDGADAYLVALDQSHRLLASEAEIVDATRRNHVQEVYLVDRHLADEAQSMGAATPERTLKLLEKHSVSVRPNPVLLERIEQADLIVYSPGTQHSSLLPSYMTPGLGRAIARNLKAIKVLTTNLQEDAEIPDASAVEIIERALFYLNEKGQEAIPAPCLITHHLLNDPARVGGKQPYIPLGRLESIEDPRLVRIANYEEGESGRHSAEKVLGPFIASLTGARSARKVAVLMLETSSLDKVAQSLLEAHRAGLSDLPFEVSCFYSSDRSLDAEIARALPHAVVNVRREGEGAEASLLQAAREGDFDHVVLFESSGMYRGEDIVNVLALLQSGRLDAVWGSRRLSVRDIRQSYRFRYRKNWVLGAVSYVGSYFLSLAYLACWGRYVTDTLSGVRAVPAALLRSRSIDLADRALNQRLLSGIFREEGEIYETPVRFFSLSPERANRTSVFDGLSSIWAVVSGRFFSR